MKLKLLEKEQFKIADRIMNVSKASKKSLDNKIIQKQLQMCMTKKYPKKDIYISRKKREIY